MRYLGIGLVLLGILMVWTKGFNFITREKVVDVGPLNITTEKSNPVSWPPVLGGIIVISGIVVMVAGRKNK